jgi:hypothetical protein
VEAVAPVVGDAVGVEGLDGREAQAGDVAEQDAVLDVHASTRPGCRIRSSSGVRKSICRKKAALSSLWPKSL